MNGSFCLRQTEAGRRADGQEAQFTLRLIEFGGLYERIDSIDGLQAPRLSSKLWLQF
jgi:hypothetical protein